MSNPPRIWLTYRPVRIGWVVEGSNLSQLVTAASWSTCLWGASRAQKVGVIDAERVIPGWKANGNPFVVREHFSRSEFASEIVDRLEYLCATEAVTEKVMPLACLLWKGLGE